MPAILHDFHDVPTSDLIWANLDGRIRSVRISRMQENNRLVLEFYDGTGRDHMGRRLDDILNKDDDWLESSHDYIQWLFPLYVASRYNPHAPLLTDEIRAAFTDVEGENSETLNKNFLLALTTDRQADEIRNRLFRLHEKALPMGRKQPGEPPFVTAYFVQRNDGVLPFDSFVRMRRVAAMKDLMAFGAQSLQLVHEGTIWGGWAKQTGERRWFAPRRQRVTAGVKH